MRQRTRLLQLCFFLGFALLLGKLAYEQLYHCALLTGSMAADNSWMLWLRRLGSCLPF